MSLCKRIPLSLSVLLFSMIFTASALFAQSTLSTGNIQGTIVDNSGAAIQGAQVTITNKATGQVKTVTTNASGNYSSGPLTPGDYTVRVEKSGFNNVTQAVLVQVGVISPGNETLSVGKESQVIEVNADNTVVDTQQATVQGVLTSKQIDTLPINGRNFLDLAQLEPGVQIQDGTTFDPTKAGYSSISINGVFGRTPRIELDGIDISDETVGTTTQNISASSIQEFNISRSSLDLATELTSSGAVNVTTKSGTNRYHGEAFGLFRDKRVGFANFPGGQDLPFQRNNFGGDLGGYLVKDKLFFFLNAERVKQDSLSPLVAAAPFTTFNGGFISPFRETDLLGKLDWQAPHNVHVFYRAGYNENKSESNFNFGYAVFANRDNTPSHALGVDFTTGNFTHSFRYGYFKFHNMIADGTVGASFPDPLPRVNIAFFDNSLQTGPNLLAPQQTYQSNNQFKYDGSKLWGTHILRYGVGFNRILGGGFASFFGLAPQVFGAVSSGPVGTFPGADGNPLNYGVALAVLGNGQGFFTEVPQFGAPAGGQQDDRFQAYIGDSWKIKPNFTLTYGIHYARDTGRSDSDLAPIPCSSIDNNVIPAALAPCSGSAQLLDQFGAGLGNRVRQPNMNFGPQAGFAWDVTNSGKTVIRGGIGLYYENSIFNNVLFDRPAKLDKGLFFGTAVLGCNSTAFGSQSISFPSASGSPTSVTSIDGLDLATQVCGQPIGSVGNAIADLQKAFQTATSSAGAALNPNFIGRSLEISSAVQGLSAYAPNYQSPRSVQMNIGVQRAIWKGGVFTADYIRNVSTHFEQTIDVNHVGDAKFLNKNAALNAISATNSAFGCGALTTSAAIDCAIAAGATINDYAGNGLDSGLSFLSGAPASAVGLTPDTGAAFGGINPLMGVGDFQFPSGRSVYNALQMSYKQNVNGPFRGVNASSFQISYTLSRFVGTGGNDQNFNPVAYDFNNPTAFIGPTSQDRTHQLSFGGTFDLKYGPRISMIGHFNSAAPVTLTYQTNGQTTGGEIFRTDVTGDGTVGDIIPGTMPGSFGRTIAAGDLAGFINNYNSTVAGTLTPAGQALVNASLFSQAQLVSLGAVKPFIGVPPAGQVGDGTFRAFDLKLSYPIKIFESVRIEPSVGFYNLFNFVNYGSVSGVLSNSVTSPAPVGQPGSANGTTPGAATDSLRIGTGSGVFSQGAPRQTEFGLRITF